ncbi:hypothetical protein D3C71_2213860 [compost metagenome]
MAPGKIQIVSDEVGVEDANDMRCRHEVRLCDIALIGRDRERTLRQLRVESLRLQHRH